MTKFKKRMEDLIIVPFRRLWSLDQMVGVGGEGGFEIVNVGRCILQVYNVIL